MAQPLLKDPNLPPPLEKQETPHQLIIHHNSAQDVSQFEAASFLLRVVAFLIDLLVLQMIQTVFSFLLHGLFLHMLAHNVVGALGLRLGVSFILTIYYMVWPLSEWGQTLGKKIVGIKVVNTRGPNPALSFSQAMKRETVGKFISGLLLFYGYLRVAQRDDRLALHDTFAETRVIKI